MLAFRQNDHAPSLTLRSSSDRPLRASIGAKRNPESTRAILEAAKTILARDGLAGFSMDAIARLAQCGKPTLYRWWPDKCALLAEVHHSTLPAFQVVGTGSNQARIDALAKGWVDAWRATLAGVALRGMLAEAQASPQAHVTLVEEGLAPYRDSLRSIFGDEDLESILRQALFPLLGVLMLDDQRSPPQLKMSRPIPVMRSVRAPSMPESDFNTDLTDSATPLVAPAASAEEHPIVKIDVTIDAASTPIRHQGEWVD